jgi:hypothetical protein
VDDLSRAAEPSGDPCAAPRSVDTVAAFQLDRRPALLVNDSGVEKAKTGVTLFAQHNGRCVWCELHDREHFLEYVSTGLRHCGKTFDAYVGHRVSQIGRGSHVADEFPAFSTPNSVTTPRSSCAMAAGTIDGAAVSSTNSLTCPARKGRARSKWDLPELVD